MKITPFYDRQYLVDSTLHTVAHSVSLGITLVVLVLLLFLGRPSIAALVAMTIPFSLLVALTLMYLTNIPIGLLSIGAIDFGIIVDGAVIVAENIARRLGEATRRDGRPNVFKVVLAASLEVERPVFFSMLMVMVAYVPLLSLTSIEGLLFRPMALTMVFALAGALLFAIFVVPVLATIMFRRGYQESESRLLALVRSAYAVTLRGLIACRWLVVAAVLCILAVVGMRVVPRLGLEFLPYMDEGTIWVRANFPEGTSLRQTAEFGKDIRQIVLGFPDVSFISVQSGRNDDGTEPFPPSRMEMMIGPKPREQWTQFKTKHELMAALGKRLREEYPTTRFNFTQPIIDMVTEDTNGTSANLAVELSGSDPDVLLGLARRTLRLLRSVPGAQDVSIDQEGPQAQLQILPDRRLCARYNVRIDDVTKLIDTALGGEPVGTLYEGDRRFDIVVKLDRAAVASPQAIGRLPVHTAEGLPVPLAQVAKIDVVDGQTMIARESSRRRLTVRCDIAGRDEGGFVAEAQRRFDAEIRPTLPDGYRVEWLGMFENLARAREHFRLLIPDHGGADFPLALGHVPVVPSGAAGAGRHPVRVHRGHLGPLHPRHAHERFHGRGLRRLVRHRHHGWRAHGPRDYRVSPAGNGACGIHCSRGARASSAHPHYGHRGDFWLAARLDGGGVGLRRAAPTGHGDRLGVVQFHFAYALRPSRALRDLPAFDPRVGSCGHRLKTPWPLIRLERKKPCRVEDEGEFGENMDKGGQKRVQPPKSRQAHPHAIHEQRAEEVLPDYVAASSGNFQRVHELEQVVSQQNYIRTLPCNIRSRAHRHANRSFGQRTKTAERGSCKSTLPGGAVERGRMFLALIVGTMITAIVARMHR